MKDNRISFYWAALILLCTGVALFVVPKNWTENAISDTGILSILTIVLISISLIVLFTTTQKVSHTSIKRSLYALQYVILIYVLREADFHRLFTDEHVTKVKFYTDQTIDLKQRIIGGLPMALFFVCFFYLLARFSSLILRHIRDRTPWAIATGLWAFTLFCSQLIDKSDWNKIIQGRIVEEMLEFGAAGFLLIAVFFSKNILIAHQHDPPD